MVSALKMGVVPEVNLLRKRFDRAMIKKLGVIKTPYSFWTADKKINPAAKELLWAAVLLEDRENFVLIAGIIATEMDEKSKASGQSTTPLTGPETTETYISELLQLAPSEQFRQLLRHKIARTIG